MKNFLVFVFTAVLASQAFSLPLHLNHSFERLDGGLFPDTFATDHDFEGIVALNNCSGSLVRFEKSSDSDTAMVLTNGHCVEGGFMKPGQFIVNKASTRGFTLLTKAAKSAGKVKATQILYGTMTLTDMALYQVDKTYEEIKSEFSVAPLTLASERAASEAPIEVLSGYWKRGYSCAVNGTVHKLKEGGWTWEQSIRYSQPGCETIPGTSGSPVVAAGTKTVVGVNNTGNESGAECTLNNPCEEDKDGKITFEKGLSYGQQISWIYDCLGADNKIDLTLQNCKLPH